MPRASLSFMDMKIPCGELASAIGQRGLHFGAGAQGAEHRDGGNCLPGELRSHVVVDHRETQHVDLQLLSGRHHVLEILAGVALQAEHHLAARNAFLQDLAMRKKLISDRGADEVGSVRVKPVLDQEIDLPEVDEPQVDRDLLRLSALRHPCTSHVPSSWMVRMRPLARSVKLLFGPRGDAKDLGLRWKNAKCEFFCWTPTTRRARSWLPGWLD